MSHEVASVIQSQIGHRAFAMMGAKQFVAGENCLQFAVGTNAKKVSKVRVVLEPSDTYTLEFWSGRSLNMRKVAEVSDVYGDSLRSTIEANTGLYLSL